MAIGTLYGPSPPNNSKISKCVVASKYAGIEVKQIPEFEVSKHAKEESYLKKFPLGEIPAFEGSDGLLLTESSAIACYFASQCDYLLGNDVKEKAQILRYVFFVESQINSFNPALLYPIFGLTTYNEEMAKIVQPRYENALKVLNDEIGSKKFLVGNSITLADIVVYCDLFNHFKHLIHSALQQKLPNLKRYFEVLSKEKHFDIQGKLEFVSDPPNYSKA